MNEPRTSLLVDFDVPPLEPLPRPALVQLPLARVLQLVRFKRNTVPGIISMLPSQWDAFLADRYAKHWLLLEVIYVGGRQQVVAGFQRPPQG